MLNARSRAVLARLAVDLTIFVTDSSFLVGDIVTGCATSSRTGAGSVEDSGFIVESRFLACFLVVEASCFVLFKDEEVLEGDSLVSVSTFRFFFGGDFGCSGAPSESKEDLGFEEDFNSVPGFSACFLATNFFRFSFRFSRSCSRRACCAF